MEGDFEAYVQDAIRRINSTFEPDFYKTYQIAEVYNSCGHHPEALNHYEACVVRSSDFLLYRLTNSYSQEQLRLVKQDSIWRRVYLTALGQFAATLVIIYRFV